MTVESTASVIEYTSDGAIVTYAITFAYLEASHIRVVIVDLSDVETELTQGPDYTVVPTTVTLTDPATTGFTVRISRVVPYTQPLDLTEQGSQAPAAIESALDRLEMQIQQIADGASTVTDFIHGDLPGGTLHEAVTVSENGFMLATDKVLLDAHLADTNNPHGVTAAQISAAPLGHVGTRGTSVHAVATQTIAGFMSAADKIKVDGLPVSVDADYPRAWTLATFVGFTSQTEYTSATEVVDGGGYHVYRALVDMRNAERIRIALPLFDDGSAAATMTLQGSDDDGTTWVSIAVAGGPAVTLSNAGGAGPSGVSIVSAWRVNRFVDDTDIWLRLVISGGDNSSTLRFGAITVQAEALV